MDVREKNLVHGGPADLGKPVRDAVAAVEQQDLRSGYD
jgi:hypothetical protein